MRANLRLLKNRPIVCFSVFLLFLLSICEGMKELGTAGGGCGVLERIKGAAVLLLPEQPQQQQQRTTVYSNSKTKHGTAVALLPRRSRREPMTTPLSC